jgi:proteasome lid subunit RPN8/RPN11
MNSSQKLLEFAPGLWGALMMDLKERGGGHRESGAFLVSARNEIDLVSRWIPYDELDSGSLNYDYVRLEPRAFTRLWKICSENELRVIADIHTHPFAPVQSQSDREHPMVSFPGHIALIVPRFALGKVTPFDVSFNVYLGDGIWESCFGIEAAARIVAA